MHEVKNVQKRGESELSQSHTENDWVINGILFNFQVSTG